MNLPHSRPRALLALQGLALALLFAHVAHTGLKVGSPQLDGFFENWIYDGLILTSASFCLGRGLLVAEERAAWLLLGLGLFAWFAGEVYYSAFLSKSASPLYPSLSDALYLLFYPASYLALVLLVRRRVREFPLSHWIDGLVAALAVAAVGSALLLQPVLESTGGSAATVATDLAYPLCDVLLLALVVGMLAITGWRPGRSWSLIGVALVAIAAADGVFLYQAATESYVEGTVLDSLWPAATLLLAFAACARSERPGPIRLEGWRVLVIPSVFALTALGLLLGSQFKTVNRAAVVLAGATLLVAIVRMALAFGENMRVLARSRREALSDSLTGLSNRRRLMDDLDDVLRVATPLEPSLLMVLDLDGFKRYNDTYGHPAGDALLARLGRRLEAAVRPYGSAYRLGGDEFCALVTRPSPGNEAITAAAAAALSERGEGFGITASLGTVLVPVEADSAERALQVADQRLYGEKSARQRSAAAEQTRDVLVAALHERAPGLRDHLDGVAALASAVGRRLALTAEEIDIVVRAAELHDVGKVAVPDAILRKPGPLDQSEREFVRQHTVVGERILSAASALVPVAKAVRSSHERYDGTGYPDGLAGDEIPIAARIVATCDAYHAMSSGGEPLLVGPALEELHRSAGTQFDPVVVRALSEVVHAPPRLGEGASPPPAAAPAADLEEARR